MMSVADEMKSKYRTLGSDPELKAGIDKIASDWSTEDHQIILGEVVLNTTYVYEDESSLSSAEVEEIL
jgi:hypothetical protein